MVSVSGREARTLLVCAGVAIAALAIRGVVVPVHRAYATSLAEYQRERDLRRREERVLGSRTAFAVDASQLRDSVENSRGRVLEAVAAPIAAMQLASHLRQIALEGDLHGMRAMDLGSDSLVASLRRARVQVEVQGEFSQLTDFVEGIESDTLPMNVIELEIVASGTVAQGRGGSTSGGVVAPVLRLRAVVSVLARVGSHEGRVGK